MKKVIIVGGGIAGLAAGVYARQSGFDTTILEMHSIPGGNSTSWSRKGYLFEGGMHWLVGSSPKTPMHRIWKEIGALQENNPVYNRDPFLTYMDKSGKTICLYRDAEKLRKHLTDISPVDKDAIDRLVKDIKTFDAMSMPAMDIKGVKVKQKSKMPKGMMGGMLKALPRMGKLNKITAGEYISKFKHEGIRAVLTQVVSDQRFTATSTIFTLAGLAVGDSGYPKGGSLQMAKNIADTFVSLGGKILYNTKVEKVLVEQGETKGVIVNGETIVADAVIVTADTLAAEKLFDIPLSDPWVSELKEEAIPLLCTFISLGVEADLKDLPENTLFPLPEPFSFNKQTYNLMGFNNYANFEGYAPEGCSALTCFIAGDTYDDWKKAKEDGTYQAKKEELANLIIEKLGELVPETKGKVQVWDVATPLTYERYCGTYRGSWMSVMQPGYKRQQYPQTVAGISNLYFAGQRLMLPGGLPVAAMTARTAVQHLCKDRDTVFQGDI